MYCATVQQDWGRLPLPSSAVVHQKGSKIVLQNVVVAKVRRADLPPKKIIVVLLHHYKSNQSNPRIYYSTHHFYSLLLHLVKKII